MDTTGDAMSPEQTPAPSGEVAQSPLTKEKDLRSSGHTEVPSSGHGGVVKLSSSYDRRVLDRIVELMQERELDPNDTDTFKHLLEDWDRWREDIAEISAKADAFDKLVKWINGKHPWYSRIEAESAKSVENASVSAAVGTSEPPQDSKESSSSISDALVEALKQIVDACYTDGSSSAWRLCGVCDTEHLRDGPYGRASEVHRADCAVLAAERVLEALKLAEAR